MDTMPSSPQAQLKRVNINTIDINEHYERRGWALSLGVTEEVLVEIVKKFGPSADRVRAYLRNRGNA